jgi:hypothetical protein
MDPPVAAAAFDPRAEDTGSGPAAACDSGAGVSMPSDRHPLLADVEYVLPLRWAEPDPAGEQVASGWGWSVRLAPRPRPRQGRGRGRVDGQDRVDPCEREESEDRWGHALQPKAQTRGLGRPVCREVSTTEASDLPQRRPRRLLSVAGTGSRPPLSTKVATTRSVAGPVRRGAGRSLLPGQGRRRCRRC